MRNILVLKRQGGGVEQKKGDFSSKLSISREITGSVLDSGKLKRHDG